MSPLLIHNGSIKETGEFGLKLTLLTKIQLVLIVFDTLVEIENLLLHLDRHLKKKQKPEILNMTFAWRKLCKAQSVSHWALSLLTSSNSALNSKNVPCFYRIAHILDLIGRPATHKTFPVGHYTMS